MASRVSATVFSPHVDSALIRRKLAQCSQHYKLASEIPTLSEKSYSYVGSQGTRGDSRAARSASEVVVSVLGIPSPLPITAISAIPSHTFHCFWIFTRSILRHKYFLVGASRRVVFSSGDLSRAQRTLKS